MLSKMARPVMNTYKDISKIDLAKSKLPELKQYAKDLNIKVSGKKCEIKLRIEEQVKKEINAVKIQKIFRGFIVSKWLKLKGTRENCVNDTDFYTLEPLSEIPYIYFIKYVDVSHNVNYGFNIKSLCILASKNKKLENPYNRENIKNPFGINMIKVIKLTNLLFPENDLIQNVAVPNENVKTNEDLFFEHIERLQQTPIEQRITSLFIHIDSLGNYTNRSWLSELNADRLYYLVVRINQLWHRIPNSSRMRICPYVSPFSPDVFGSAPFHVNISMVVKMAEILTHSGIDNDNKQLGAMYFLSGLTLVSHLARDQMPWLYDNYFTIVN